MSRLGLWCVHSCLCFPRVSGDEPGYVLLTDEEGLFSPRERG